MFYLCFIELARCDLVPTSITVDGVSETPIEKYMHVKFEESVLFAFGPQGSRFLHADHEKCEIKLPFAHADHKAPGIDLPFASIHKSVVNANKSKNNEYHVPIFQGKGNIGAIRCKINSVVSDFSVQCREIDFSHRPVWIGHRGAGANRAGRRLRENTLLSFNHAMSHPGLSGIELDVCLTNDKQLVVYHDLEFPTSVNGRETNLPVSSLQYCDMQLPRLKRSGSADNVYLKAAGCVQSDCPLLADVLLGLAPAAAGIVIELKFPTNKFVSAMSKYTRTDLVEAVLECLQNNRELVKDRWIVLSSFDPDIVWMLHSAIRAPSKARVVHNVWFGHEKDEEDDNTVDFGDARNRWPKAAIHQALVLNAGIALEASYALSSTFDNEFKTSNVQPLLTYGACNLEVGSLRAQRSVHAFFIDNMNIINRY